MFYYFLIWKTLELTEDVPSFYHDSIQDSKGPRTEPCWTPQDSGEENPTEQKKKPQSMKLIKVMIYLANPQKTTSQTLT